VPVKACSVNGKPGFKWGDRGTCYTHDGSEASRKAARKKAVRQALAIGGGKMPDA
jgi:hypothetical protein